MYGLAQDQYAAEEQALKELMRKETGRQIPVNATVYTADRQKLFDALADNEVALMLSWHEGFGLVGWEAISAGVPLVVSKRTGLYKLLNSPDDPVGAACVSVVDVRGSDGGMPDDADVAEVADALFRIAVNWEQFYQKAITLRDHLAKKYTWEGCARDALKACAFPLVAADPETAPPPEGPTTPQSASREQETSAGGTAGEHRRLVCADEWQWWLAGVVVASLTLWPPLFLTKWLFAWNYESARNWYVGPLPVLLPIACLGGFLLVTMRGWPLGTQPLHKSMKIGLSAWGICTTIVVIKVLAIWYDKAFNH
jgi:hypothetical protein